MQYTDIMRSKWLLILLSILLLITGWILIAHDYVSAYRPDLTLNSTQQLTVSFTDGGANENGIAVQETDDPASTAFFMLGPNTSLQSTFFGVCKHITNLTDDVMAYIPTGENNWPDFDSRYDEHGGFIVEVKSCE